MKKPKPPPKRLSTPEMSNVAILRGANQRNPERERRIVELARDRLKSRQSPELREKVVAARLRREVQNEADAKAKGQTSEQACCRGQAEGQAQDGGRKRKAAVLEGSDGQDVGEDDTRDGPEEEWDAVNMTATLVQPARDIGRECKAD